MILFNYKSKEDLKRKLHDGIRKCNTRKVKNIV